MEWTPLLDGELAAAANDAIDAIAEALAALPLSSDRRWAHDLSSGTAGWALFHAYREDDERAMELVSGALDAVPAMQMDASLFHGLTGLAWTVEHLGKHFYD